MNSQSTIKALLVFLIGTSLLPSAFGQENYLPGYVIANDGDKITGFINYLNWDKNPKKITFKKDQEGEPTSFIPKDIVEFGVSDEIYSSAIVQIETSPFHLNNLDSRPTLNFIKDKVFLQKMIGGEKSLYYHKGNQSKESFYIQDDEKFVLLVHKTYYTYEEEIKKIAQNKTFQEQLINYLSDCQPIATKSYRSDYKKQSLEKLFQEYYKCIGSQIEFQKKSEKITTEFGIVAGITATKLSFWRNSLAAIVQTNYPISFKPTGGVFFNLVLPRSRGKLSIYNELIYTQYHAKGEYSSSRSTQTNSQFDYSYIKLNNQIRYNFSVGKIRAFANLGIFNALAIRSKMLKETYRVIPSEPTQETSWFSTRNFEQGIVGGMGSKIDRLSFELRHEFGTGMSSSPVRIARTSTSYLLVGYRL